MSPNRKKKKKMVVINAMKNNVMTKKREHDKLGWDWPWMKNESIKYIKWVRFIRQAPN